MSLYYRIHSKCIASIVYMFVIIIRSSLTSDVRWRLVKCQKIKLDFESFMHFKLNWIFIDDIYFKRIENWLHNDNNTMSIWHLWMSPNDKLSKKGEWTSESCFCCGCCWCCWGFLFSSFKRNVISFLNFFLHFCLKRVRRKKSWTWFYAEINVCRIQLHLTFY